MHDCPSRNKGICRGLGSWDGVPWQRVPRLGEAENPGPGFGFDDSDGEFGSEGSWGPLPGDEQWQPDEEEHAEYDEPWIAESASSAAAATAAAAATSTVEEQWLHKHARVTFVPVANKKVTKQSKFLGGKNRLGIQVG